MPHYRFFQTNAAGQIWTATLRNAWTMTRQSRRRPSISLTTQPLRFVLTGAESRESRRPEAAVIRRSTLVFQRRTF